MTIGVSGASGHLGRAVVSELLQRPGGHEVVAITRTPETISGPAQGRFQNFAHADMADPEVLNAVIWLACTGNGSSIPRSAQLPAFQAMRQLG